VSTESAVPVFYGLLVLVLTALWPMVLRSRVSLVNVGAASMLAGPIFATCVALPILLAILPHGPGFDSFDASMFLLVVAAVIVVGAVIALPANLIGSAVMIRIGDHIPWARERAAWALIGSVAASTPSVVGGLLEGDDIGLLFAFAITGACCALICRRGIFRPDPVEIP